MAAMAEKVRHAGQYEEYDIRGTELPGSRRNRAEKLGTEKAGKTWRDGFAYL